MTDDERRRAFKKAVSTAAARLPAIQRDTVKAILAELARAAARIALEISRATDLTRRARLEGLKREIGRTIETFRSSGESLLHDAASRAWLAGRDLIAAPMQAAGITLDLAQRINPRALVAMRSFLTAKIKDVSTQAIDRINGELAQVLIGTRSQSDAITAVQRILGGATRRRASTIAYTEIGRAYSIASQASLAEAATRVPGLGKRWVKSGKLHPRPAHVLAHNQVVSATESFIVDGEALRFPRDPDASAENTINCGCMMIPVLPGTRIGDRVVDAIDENGRVRLVTPAQRAASTASVIARAQERLRALGIDEDISGVSVTTSATERGVLDDGP